MKRGSKAPTPGQRRLLRPGPRDGNAIREVRWLAMVTVSLVPSDDLAARLRTGALQRRKTLEEFAVDALQASPLLSRVISPGSHDALEAFLGCGSSISRTDGSIGDLREELSKAQLSDRE